MSTINARYSPAYFLMLAIISLFTSPSASAQVNAIVYPKGGEVIDGGTDLPISWMSDAEAESVSVRVWDGTRGIWIVVADRIPSAIGGVQWNVPADFSGDMYRLELTFHGSSSIPIRGDAFFAITGGQAVSGVGLPASLEPTFSLAMSPNPVTEILHTRTGNIVPDAVRIISAVNGVEVRAEYQINGTSVDIDIRGLAAGPYILEVLYGRTRAAERFIVVR